MAILLILSVFSFNLLICPFENFTLPGISGNKSVLLINASLILKLEMNSQMIVYSVSFEPIGT